MLNLEKTRSGTVTNVGEADVSRGKEEFQTKMYKEGRARYGGDMTSAGGYLQASLLALLDKGDQLPVHMQPNYTDLSSKPPLDPDLKKIETFIKKVVQGESSLNKEDKYKFAANMRWLGHCFQNINLFTTLTVENKSRFDLLYDSAETLLRELCKEGLHTEIGREANWELAELLYNTTRFRYGLTFPDDDLGKVETLHQLKPLMDNEGNTPRSLQLHSQIENILMIEKGKLSKMEKNPDIKTELEKQQWEHVCHAVDLASDPVYPNPFLKAMFFNNKAALAIKLPVIKMDDTGISIPESVLTGKNIGDDSLNEVGQWVHNAISYAAEDSHNHYYYSIFYCTAAKLEMIKGNHEKASEHLDQASAICEKFPASSGDIAVNVACLKLTNIHLQKGIEDLKSALESAF